MVNGGTGSDRPIETSQGDRRVTYPHALGPGLSTLMNMRGCPSGPPPARESKFRQCETELPVQMQDMLYVPPSQEAILVDTKRMGSSAISSIAARGLGWYCMLVCSKRGPRMALSLGTNATGSGKNKS